MSGFLLLSNDRDIMNLWMLQLRHVSAGHIAYNARDKNTEGDKLGYDHGFGDMWKIEDRAATKTDSWLQIFNFNEGDFILYDLEASMSSDYKSGGTH